MPRRDDAHGDVHDAGFSCRFSPLARGITKSRRRRRTRTRTLLGCHEGTMLTEKDMAQRFCVASDRSRGALRRHEEDEGHEPVLFSDTTKARRPRREMRNQCSVSCPNRSRGALRTHQKRRTGTNFLDARIERRRTEKSVYRAFSCPSCSSWLRESRAAPVKPRSASEAAQRQ